MCHGWLGQLDGFFGIDEIRLINTDSCDELDIGRLESSLDCGVTYLSSVGFSRLIFDLGG